MNKKLKKKIWIISSIILTAYIGTLIIYPSSWLSLLPIIIPTSVLTIGIPTYSIIKCKKSKIEKTVEKPETKIKVNEFKTNQNIKQINKNYQLNPISEFRQEEKIEDKPKIKTKGTN